MTRSTRRRRDGKTNSKLSTPLRRKRLVRTVLAAGLGILWSSALMVLVVQLGWISYFRQGPLVLAVVFGTISTALLTATQMGARRLRIEMVTRGLGGIILVTMLVNTVVLFGGAPPAMAQDRCAVSVSGPGLSQGQAQGGQAQGGQAPDGPFDMAATTERNPLIVDPSELDQITIRWNIDSTEGLTGRTWRIWTEIAGFDTDLFTAEGEDGSDTYLADGFPATIVPGVYRVWGEFDGICEAQVGYVRVTGSPLNNPLGITATIALGAGLAGSLTLARRSRLDLWSLTTVDGVHVDVLHHGTDRVVRGPLLPGGTYDAQVSVNWPDPAAAYTGLGAPIDVAIGALGESSGPRLRTIRPAAHTTATVAPFEVPADGSALELVVDLSIEGNPLDSIRVSTGETSTLGLHIKNATGSLLYRAGNFTAAHLLSVAPIDASIHLHGNKAGTSFEVWRFAGPSTLRVSQRTRVERSELVDAAERYRHDLRQAIAEWAGFGEAATNDEVLIALARSGSRLRDLLLGGGGDSGVEFDGRIMIAPDLETTGSMTFPWAGLYEGQIADDAANAEMSVCTTFASAPKQCNSHADTVVCPTRFWGFRHELTWPTGWVADATSSPQPNTNRGPGSRQGLLGPYGRLGGLGRVSRAVLNGLDPRRHRPNSSRLGTDRHREYVPNRLDNDKPVTVLSTIPSEYAYADTFAEVKNRFDVKVESAQTWRGFKRLNELHRDHAEIVYFLAHGEYEAKASADAFTLHLDFDIDGDKLSSALREAPFGSGPLTFINACNSGVIGLEQHHGFIGALVQHGARAVIVTETQVLAPEAGQTASTIIAKALSGTAIPRAIVEARREDLAANGRLSMLAYSYYGPAGLHFTNPVPRPVVDATAETTTPGAASVPG